MNVFAFLLASLYMPSIMAASDFNTMIQGVEQKLPIAQKQAETLIKMMNSDKHREKIQTDLDTLAPGKFPRPKARDTYLYRVFKELSISFEESAIAGDLLAVNAGSAQPLYPLFPLGFCQGRTGAYENDIARDESFLRDEKKAQSLISLCRKLIAIITPVQLLAREKLKMPDKYMDVLEVHGVDKSWEETDGENIYAVLCTGVTPHSSYNTVYSDVIGNKEYASHYPVVYLNFLGDMAKYLEEIGVATYPPTLWRDGAAKVQEILARRAETKELGDLKTGVEPEGTNHGGKGDKDLNLDDLKLPAP